MFRNYLEQERHGTGGILFIYTSAFMCLVFIVAVTLIQVSTSRTVAESVEHTIALECLAACYLDPQGNGVDKSASEQSFDLNKQFVLNDKTFSPKGEFESIMQQFHLMQPGAACSKGHLIYKYNDKSDVAHQGKSTFDLALGGYPYNDNFWTQKISIVPNNVKVTIEKSYTSWK